MFKTIVVALDGSERSFHAFKYAQSLAQKYVSRLIVVHAYPHTSDLHASEGYEKLLSTRKIAGEKIIEAARKLIGQSSIEMEADLLEGPSADAILSVAETRSADLIVLGTRGMGSIKGLLFGSVATKVSHHAACPVLVVR